MKQILVTLGSILLALSASVNAAGNPVKGKHLFEKDPDQCLSCHPTGAKFNKATDLKQLDARVRKCDMKAKTNWFDYDITDVTSYLNKQYYHF